MYSSTFKYTYIYIYTRMFFFYIYYYILLYVYIMYTHLYIHLYIHFNIFVYILVDVYTCLHTSIYIYFTFVYFYIHLYPVMYMYVLQMLLYTLICVLFVSPLPTLAQKSYRPCRPLFGQKSVLSRYPDPAQIPSMYNLEPGGEIGSPAGARIGVNPFWDRRFGRKEEKTKGRRRVRKLGMEQGFVGR